VRRKFYDLEQAHASPVAREALQRIGALYGIEEQIRGRPPEQRREVRQAQAQSLLDALRQWFEEILSKLSRKSETTAAIRYALVRWDALTRYIEDGHIEIDNNAAERSLRGVALGRKNYLFAGSDAGGERARSHLQPDWFSETQWPRSRSLSARSAHPHRRSPHQPH
jgi:transposase